ncbi:hypothetical protein PTSG_04801 [Salpingoeca rosetta]|uniref:Uncharacterized protein n=1 Tax=Salpingoeca rosetta (strain ATCC 50818 / BSB-021) TaxID=946362 RepID=F2U9R0_SALR5|nr:uncharacterized protein PTSG_04801 [Salpingoeca rosetta]EGD73087.1 hypothetical protein PTSG_04801 [Salpingoeca rosetta]|eukprot:XP_004994118.1 hypothetical protein PTSG_04801 [Salpingoeca rosetta]
MAENQEVQTFRALYNFEAQEDDELDLQAGDLIDVYVVHEGEWGTGVSRRNLKEGAFPWSYVQPYKQAGVGHKFEPITVTVPTVDWHTHAFIWGAGMAGEAVQCTVCGFTCHKRSKFFVENNSASECIPNRNIVRPSSRPIDDWTVEDVHLFMVATKLNDYALLFLDKGVTGGKLKSLNHKKLQSLGVDDTPHRKMVMACIEEILGQTTNTASMTFQQRCQLSKTEEFDPVQIMDLVPIEDPHDSVVVVKGHRFKLKSYANMTWCDSSLKPLFGLQTQGLQCTVCGYNVSRQYLYQVPSCQPEMAITHSPLPAGAKCGHMFGVPLEGQMHTGKEVPIVIEKCIQALESGKGLKTSHLYVQMGNVSRVRVLQAELLMDPNKTLEGQDAHVVATLLKRYFAELPEPLVPFAWYDRFIAAALLPTEAEQVAELDRLVPQLPPQRQKIMEVLLAHLGRVLGNYKSTKVDAEALGKAWGHLFLMPAPREMGKAAVEHAAQCNAVKLLIGKCKCGGLPTTASGAAPPLHPRRKASVRRPASSLVTQSNYENVVLPRQPTVTKSPRPPPPRTPRPRVNTVSQKEQVMDDAWYAGNMDRAAAEATLAPLADGSFLVRASRTRRGFTLTVKFLEVRHIVIVESKGKFGFSEPTTFPSVADLIRHFQSVSLAYYNAELETTLAYPYKTAPRAGENDVQFDDELADDDIYVSNVYALRERLARQHRDFRHERQAPPVEAYEQPPEPVDKEGLAHLDKQMKELERSLKAQQMISRMLREHLQLNETKRASAGTEQNAVALETHHASMKSLLDESERKEKDILADLEQTAKANQAASNYEEVKLKKREEAAPARPPPAAAPQQSGLAMYYLGQISRTDAKRYLAGQPVGTFLVRKSGRGHPYTMDVVYDGEVKHIPVLYDGVLYGLAKPLSFDSVEALVKFYRKVPLSDSINTILTGAIKERTTIP